MELVKVSDLKKIFVKWSHGTLYNRLESLKIKANADLTVKNEATGIVLYNRKAIELLKEQYLKEFTSNTAEERELIDKTIFDFLSSKSNVRNSVYKEVRDNKKTLKTDTNDVNDKVDNLHSINNVNLTYINENYILKSIHNEIVSNLQAQVALLQSQLEKETAANEKLVDTIRLREQRETVIEQQNLVKLQNDIKLIENSEQKKKSKGLGIFALFRNREGAEE